MKLLHLLVLSLALFALPLFAQEHGAAAPEGSVQAAEAHGNAGPKAEGLGDTPPHQSNEAAGEVDEHAEFKESASVKFVARVTGLSLSAAYWALVGINFAIIAGLIGWALRKNLPGMFRSRTEAIRKSMDEARKASDDANRRLGEIGDRLSRLDAEVSGMRRTAEADAAAEEARIRAAAEDDRRKIVEMTEQEIEAAARAARRELKAYVADLAVSLAEKRIRVDEKTDEALVHVFVQQLGKDRR